MFPELVVHVDEAVAGDHAHGDLIRELLGLKIRMVGEHPHMTQFVSQHCSEFICAQALEEPNLDGESETPPSLVWRFHRNDQRNLRLDRDVDIVGNPQLFSQTIDDELNAFGEER